MLEKECKKCKTVKPIDSFCIKNSRKDGRDSWCKLCQSEQRKIYRRDIEAKKEYDSSYRADHWQRISDYKKEWHKRNSERVSKRNRNKRITDIISVLINERKYRCEPSMEFSIVADDFQGVPMVCPILEIPIIISEKVTTHNSPSLDRIDNSKGYTKENTWIISHLANRMKNNADDLTLYNFCRWILGEGFVSDIQLEYDSSNNYRGCRERARKKNLPFDLERSDIEVPQICPALGVPLYRSKQGFDPNVASVDRIIPELGYVKDNIQVISMQANTMKNNAPPELLLKFATWFLSQRKEINENI